MKVIKRIISTPNIVVPTVFLAFAFFTGKVNGFYALAIIAFLVLFAVLNVGDKQLWK